MQRQFTLHATAVMAWVALTGLGFAVTSALRSSADEPAPSLERGRDLALRFCSSCHLTPYATTSVPTGIPSLRAIANKPGQTAQKIEHALINPHPPMPDAQLTRHEILGIVLYLDTLRTDRSAPPFLPPPVEKQVFPKPS